MSGRPELRVELGCLGPVDPFCLRVVEHPGGSGVFYVEDPEKGRRGPIESAGLNLVGAGQALLGLSMQWLSRTDGGYRHREAAGEPPPFGEARLRIRRREARLLASLMRRHLRRLPQPPAWMPSLQRALGEIDEFLRWEDP